jgi:transcriptional regulator with XRE-family HTH domain
VCNMRRTALDRLREYREKHYAKGYEMAADLRITEAQLSQLLGGKRRPGLDVAVRIEDATGIPARSWADMRVSKVKRTNKDKALSAPVSDTLTADVVG